MIDALLNAPERTLLGKPVSGGSYFKPRTLTKGTCPRPIQKIDEAGEPSDRIIEVPCLQWRWTTPLRECLELVNEGLTLGLLDRFIELHSQSDDQILEYARKHGVLGLCACKHPRPFGHSRPRFNRPSLSPVRMCQPLTREPFDVWRKYSREAALTLRMVKLSYGKPQDWSVANDPLEPEWRIWTQRADSAVQSKNIARKNFFRRQAQATAIRWIKESSGSLSCIPASDREVTIGADCQTLFDVLAVQLLMAVTHADAISTCANCWTFFTRTLGPNKRLHPRIYCYKPECKTDGKNRFAQRSRYKDQRYVRDAFERGEKPADIITSLSERRISEAGIDPNTPDPDNLRKKFQAIAEMISLRTEKTVKRWLKKLENQKRLAPCGTRRQAS